MKRNCYLAKLLSCLAFVLIIPLISPASAFAQVPEAWSSRCVDRNNPDVATLQGFECIFINITRILVPLAGLLLFVMLVLGSFQLMTAAGDAKKNQKAKATLTYAIVGLVVFFGIWFILLLIKTITGIDVTRFEIPGPQ